MNRLQFWILISIVAISGFSQGMLLPLISIIFEQDGISSTMNGLNATGLYIGILIISPFMEYPLRKYGYKPIIILGGLLVIVSLAFFPLYKSFWFWFFLRLCIGIGDNALHFGTQTWITSSTLKEHRGRNISLYGLFFGIGFAAGPLITPLVTISESFPFILSACLCLISWLFLFLLKNEKPVQDDTEEVAINSFKETASRFKTTLSFCWVALLPALCYGFLEASLNGSFPIYGLRIGLDVSYISIALAAFAVGGVITQLPLGIFSDRIGRRRLLTYILFFGSLTFFAASFLESSALALTICLLFAGMLVGSTFSLGISFMTDVTPKSLLPTGNLLCGIAFSLGSLLGPYLGGVFIQVFTSISFFVVIGSILFMIFVIISTRKQEVTY